MRLMQLLILLACVLLLGGCASQAERPDANYTAYLQLVEKQQAESELQRQAFATMAQRCTSDACVSQVAAIAALAGASGRGQAPIQQYVPRESTAAKFGLALVSQIAPIASAAVSWHATSTSRDISMKQFDFLGGAVHDLTAGATALGTVAGSMTPSINVGRDYISGSVSIDDGTHVGRDLISGTQDNGLHVGGDWVGHDKIVNTGVFNTGTIDRYQSAGPYDDHTTTTTLPPTPPTGPTTPPSTDLVHFGPSP